MKLFKSNGPKDVIFLEPVKKAGEELPKGKIRMLYCDSQGRVYASLINKEVYKLALEGVDRMAKDNKDYATLGLEISPGNFLPQVVEIGTEEVWALENILEHARRSGSIPDILIKHVRQIIKLGERRRKEDKKKHKKEDKYETVATPDILNRLPYYSERDIEFSVPIYKAGLCFPLLVLKTIELDGNSSINAKRLLVLDNDGDMAVIKVPVKMMVEAERRLEDWSETSNIPSYIMVNRISKGLDINFMPVTHAQKKSLDAMAKRFTETGEGKLPVPAAAKKVLVKAREIAESLQV